MDDLPENFRNTGICIGGPLDHERHVYDVDYNVLRVCPTKPDEPPESEYRLVKLNAGAVVFGVWVHETVALTALTQIMLDHYVTNTGSQTPAGS